MTAAAPARICRANPMLAQDLKQLVRWGEPAQFGALRSWLNKGWAAEEKFDGCRVWIVIDAAGTRLVTKTADRSEVAEDLAAVRGDVTGLAGTVLDAEWMAPPLPGETAAPLGRSTGWLNSSRTNARILRAFHKRPAVLKVFDVITLAGTDVTGYTHDERRAALAAAAGMILEEYPGCGVELVGQLPATAAAIEGVLARGGEGVILKYRAGRYQPGRRSDAWRKVKATGTVDVYLTGNWTPGQGGRAGEIGSVEAAVMLPDGSALVVGSVAVKPQLVAEYTRRAAAGELAGIVWEVETNGWTGTALRHPRMLRVRADKTPARCEAAQLDSLPAAPVSAAAPTVAACRTHHAARTTR